MSLFLLLAAAVLFSTGGAAIKATTLTPWQVAGFRSGIAAVSLFLLLPDTRRWRRKMAPAAAAYAGTLLLFVLATKLTTAANAIFLQSTAPIYLLLIGPLLLKEPVRRRDLWFACAVGCGMVLLLGRAEPASRTAPDPGLGNALGAASGVFWALTLAALRWLGRDSGYALASVAWGNVLAFAVALPLAVPVIRWSPVDAAALVYLGVVQIGLAYVCLTQALRHVSAFEAAAILLVEPALNPVWAWMLHGERPGGLSVLGGAVILAAIAAKAAAERRSI